MRKTGTANPASELVARYPNLPISATTSPQTEMIDVESTAAHNILIIDDNESVCRSLIRYLKDSADLVLSAGSFEEALEILHKERIHVLICDFNLGSFEPNGVQMIEAIRKTRPEIRCAIILTGESIVSIPPSQEVDAVLEKGGNFLLLRSLVEKKA